MTKLLLDTHVFIWINREPEKLTDTMKAVLSNQENSFYLSMASLWEMQIKIMLGKLGVMPTLEETIATIHRDNIYQILPITEHHLINLKDLPDIHKDPFDRLIISQAITENMTLISSDRYVMKYPIDVVN